MKSMSENVTTWKTIIFFSDTTCNNKHTNSDAVFGNVYFPYLLVIQTNKYLHVKVDLTLKRPPPCLT